MTMDMRIYKGRVIHRCLWANDPHGGKWVVQTYGLEGVPWSDEWCPHYASLKETRQAINTLIDEEERTHGTSRDG